jgi:hypothetical protein
MKRISVLLTACVLVFALVATSFADSWALPQPQKYYSANKQYYIEVIPKKIESQLKFFEQKAKGKPSRGSKSADKNNFCKGILAKRDSDGVFHQIWAVPLSNEVAPVNAVVSNDGQYAVTFDNWHMVGYGDNVVVIYGPGGRLIKKLSLADIFSESELTRLPRSVSSIWWGRDHYIDGANEILILRVVSKWNGSFDDAPELKDVKVELKTGKISEREK